MRCAPAVPVAAHRPSRWLRTGRPGGCVPAVPVDQQPVPLSFTVPGALAVPLAVKPTVTDPPAGRDGA